MGSMRILVTGSSGWLGQTLVPRLAREGHQVVGLDPVPSPLTQVTGSIADRDLVRSTIRGFRANAIVHAAALHKPNIGQRAKSDFVAVNVQGTLNLLEEAVACGVDRFVFTSTTSLMISRDIRAGRAGGASRATWITEEMVPLLPRNIYGATKFAAEHLCRVIHEQDGLPILILRTSRFFPEEDDMTHAIAQSEPNTKANEFLFRRLTVEDAAEGHVAALEKAPQLGFDTFIISARTPFSANDCEELIVDAPSVVARYFPQYRELYARAGWTMFQSIDRVYDSSRAAERLGFVCRTGFKEKLEELERDRLAKRVV
ncbi:MAG TPA: NAD(P)-dependent oxidoreductase [Candidatus Binataceae bacterium]|nr:NAD(P)-dependent oxidoreductase [Candidatus Binataceae bacterium]